MKALLKAVEASARILVPNWSQLSGLLIEDLAPRSPISWTTAVIENFSITIAVTTRHLTGAQGTPVWFLNPFDACCCWTAEPEMGDWEVGEIP
jgi:hypothetical protein